NLQITTPNKPGPKATHRIPQTFDLRPSQPLALDSEQSLNRPDELMITWGNTLFGSTASVYWPQVKAADVLELASKLYAIHQLSASDPHTISCPITRGVTFIPIPYDSGENF